MKIQPNGLYHFITEMPGNEEINGWGPDPEPHIHFDVMCTGCAGDHGVVDGEYKYWNKFYPEGICELISCYGGETMLALEAGPEHKAQKKEVVDGELRYKYDMAIPAADLNFKYGRPWGSGRG